MAHASPPAENNAQVHGDPALISWMDSHHCGIIAVKPMALMVSTSPSDIVHAAAPILGVHDIPVHSTGLRGWCRGTRYGPVQECCYRRGSPSKNMATCCVHSNGNHRACLPWTLTPPQSYQRWHERLHSESTGTSTTVERTSARAPERIRWEVASHVDLAIPSSVS